MRKATVLAALFALFALLAAGSALAAPGAVESDAADVVVLLDSSQSVLPYFQDVTDYVLSSVVRDFLRFGDTFHLLTFGDSAQTEIAQRMGDERDVKSVLGRLYLLYPLARHSDFLGGLGYLRQYLVDLPESRRKVVVVITDGVQNSPPGSTSSSLDRVALGSGIESECSAIRARGWDLRIIRLPFVPAGTAGAPGAAGGTAQGAVAGASGPGAAAAGSAEPAGESYLDVAASALGAKVSSFEPGSKESLARTSLSLPSVEYPPHLGKRGYDFSFPLKVTNDSDAELGLELEALALGSSDILAKKSFLKLGSGKSGVLDIRVSLPDSLEPGELSLVVEPRFAGGVRVSPQNGILALSLHPSALASIFRSSLRFLLFAILLVLGLAAVLFVVLTLRRVSRRAEAPVVDAVLDSATPTAARGAPGRSERAASPRPTTPATAATTATGSPRSEAADVLAAASRPPHEGLPLASKARGAAASRGEAASLAGQGPVPDEHETAIAREAEELAKAAREDSTRAASVLGEAASRPSSLALEKLAAFKERREREKTREAAKAKAKPEAPASRPATEAPPVRRPGTIRVEMRVEDQNANIGMRNVHTIHAGASKSVGGGRSDFLVFLVPAARRAAELHFDGERLTFLPLKPELFPGVEGSVEDCLGQEILMLGKNGYPLVLRFSVYERPADKINRLLHCIETPGLVRDLDA
ncbi:MAG TPA: VWA domain-containing protein [Spirochaetia bacterium]|nr:VWA domain-containing protein [Spirochaetia bacterium]HRZ65761.1 VWA domain-containing protein [Spirochaetia bacterium]